MNWLLIIVIGCPFLYFQSILFSASAHQLCPPLIRVICLIGAIEIIKIIVHIFTAYNNQQNRFDTST